MQFYNAFSSTSYVKEVRPANLLVSFYACKLSDLKKIFAVYEPERLMIDCGAYSVFTLGLPPINHDQYIDFTLELSKIKPDTRFIALDVIGSGEKSFQNYLYAKKYFPKFEPVWHDDDDLKLLDEYVKSAEVVMIGLKKLNRKDKHRRLIKYIFNKYPNKKFHSLAQIDPSMINFPWFSSDSSTAIQNAVFANASVKWTGSRFVRGICKRQIMTTVQKCRLISMSIFEFNRFADYHTRFWQSKGVDLWR